MNPEHPALPKLLCALPLLFTAARLPLGSPAWAKADEVDFANQFMYENALPAQRLLLPARCVTIALSLSLGLGIALWTRSRFGVSPALLALALYILDPNLTAHGRYVTTDMWAAAFIFFACVSWCEAVLRDRTIWYAFAGLALGLALASKFSAFYLLAVFAALACFRRPRWRGVITVCAVACLVLACIYAPEVIHTGRLHSYFAGLHSVLAHNTAGQTSYLLGRISEKGFWYYFPVAFAVKTPTAVLLLSAIACALIVWKRPAPRFEILCLAIPFTLYWIFALASNLNIGIRHLLPIYPFLYVMIAVLACCYLPKAAILAFVALLAAESLSIYPDYLAFFNWPSGGPGNGPKYLLDSNIDWGQDTRKLRTYLDDHNIPAVCMLYFGSAYPAYNGIQELPLPKTADRDARARMNCIVAASVTPLYGLYVNDEYSYLRERRPIAKIGYSIYIFDFRKHGRP